MRIEEGNCGVVQYTRTVTVRELKLWSVWFISSLSVLRSVKKCVRFVNCISLSLCSNALRGVQWLDGPYSWYGL